MPPKRTNILDALATVAASSPDTTSRGHVARDHGTRDPVARDPGALTPALRDPVTTGPRGTDADGYRMRIRREKPHVSVYAHPRVLDAIRDLAVAQRKKPHDLYIEGFRLMLAQYGLDLDALERG